MLHLDCCAAGCCACYAPSCAATLVIALGARLAALGQQASGAVHAAHKRSKPNAAPRAVVSERKTQRWAAAMDAYADVRALLSELGLSPRARIHACSESQACVATCCARCLHMLRNVVHMLRNVVHKSAVCCDCPPDCAVQVLHILQSGSWWLLEAHHDNPQHSWPAAMPQQLIKSMRALSGDERARFCKAWGSVLALLGRPCSTARFASFGPAS